MKNFFITGATGFLGSNLLKVILADDEKSKAYLLVQAKNNKAALKRKEALIETTFSNSERSKVYQRLEVVRGDISKDKLGLNKEDFQRLQDAVDTIYHCAAVREFGYRLEAIRKVNVTGTENLLKTALLWKEKGRLRNVNHISTVYVAGDYNGTFYEDQLDVSQKFNNTYEQSKFEAEQVVLRYRKRGLEVDVYRPAVIADTIPANKDNLSMAFRFLTIFTLQLFGSIPADRFSKFNLVPVDTASKAIYLISTAKNRPRNQNYHIVNSRFLKVDILLDVLSSIAGFKKPGLISKERFKMEDLSLVQSKLIGGFIPYLNQRLSFDTRNASSVLRRYKFKIPAITKKLLIKALKHYQTLGLIPKKGELCY